MFVFGDKNDLIDNGEQTGYQKIIHFNCFRPREMLGHGKSACKWLRAPGCVHLAMYLAAFISLFDSV